MSRYLQCTLIIALGLLLAAPLLAYVPSRTEHSGTPLRWMYTNRVFIEPDLKGSKDLEDGAHIEVIRRAIENWHDAVGDASYIRFEQLPASAEAKKELDREGCNVNAIVFVEKGWPRGAASAAALTTVFFIDDPESRDDGRIVDADIEFNGQDFTFSDSGAPDRTDVENTLTHELGHVLGLDHPCDDGAERVGALLDDEGQPPPSCYPTRLLPSEMLDLTMYNFAELGETKKRTPKADDIRGVVETYPIAEDPDRAGPVCFTGGGSLDDGDTGGGCTVTQAADHRASLALALLIGVLWLSLRRRRCV